MTASFENAARIREARKAKAEAVPEPEDEPIPSPEPPKAAKRKPRKPKVVEPVDIPEDDDNHDWGSDDSETL
jgi:anti-sigma factor RsiW